MPDDALPDATPLHRGCSKQTSTVDDCAAVGDRKTVEGLYRRYAGRVEAFARGLLRDADLAEDVVQTVFRKRLDRPPDGSSDEAWLFAVARNECLSILRRQQVRRRYRPTPQYAAAADEGVVTNEAKAQLNRALQTLSQEDRELLTRRFFDHESYETIARDRDTIPSTLSTRVHRLLKRLRRELPDSIDPNGVSNDSTQGPKHVVP